MTGKLTIKKAIGRVPAGKHKETDGEKKQGANSKGGTGKLKEKRGLQGPSRAL